MGYELSVNVVPTGGGLISIYHYCNFDLRYVKPTATAYEVACKMKASNISEVVVKTKKKGREEILGVITDRDLVMKIMADDMDMDQILAKDILSGRLESISGGVELYDVIQLMERKGIRTVLVKDSNDRKVGYLNFDIIIKVFSQNSDYLPAFTERRVNQVARKMSPKRTVLDMLSFL